MSRLHSDRQRKNRRPPAPMERGPVTPATPAQTVTQVPGKAAPQDFSAVAVTTDRVLVMDVGDGRHSIRWWNDGPDRVVIGGSAVTASSGTPIEVDSGFLEKDAPNAEWWAVSEGTSTLRRTVIK